MYSSEIKPLGQGLPASTGSSFASDLQSGVDIRQLPSRLEKQELAEMGMKPPGENVQTIFSFPSHVKVVIACIHVLCCGLCLSTILDMDQYDRPLFRWHPVFMTLGYTGPMAYGIILALKFRHLEGPRRVPAIQAHALVQLCAACFILAGFWVIWETKVRPPNEMQRIRSLAKY
jgi:hypothetical protein